MSYGKKHEEVARKELEVFLKKNVIDEERKKSFQIELSGIWIDAEITYLGASPDGSIDLELSELKNFPSAVTLATEETLEILYEVENGGIAEIKWL